MNVYDCTSFLMDWIRVFYICFSSSKYKLCSRIMCVFHFQTSILPQINYFILYSHYKKHFVRKNIKIILSSKHMLKLMWKSRIKSFWETKKKVGREELETKMHHRDKLQNDNDIGQKSKQLLLRNGSILRIETFLCSWILGKECITWNPVVMPDLGDPSSSTAKL